MPAFAITFAAGCARQRIGIRTLEAPATTKVAVATTHLQPELAAAELASPSRSRHSSCRSSSCHPSAAKTGSTTAATPQPIPRQGGHRLDLSAGNGVVGGPTVGERGGG